MININLSYGDITTQPLESAVTDHKLIRSLDLSGNNISAENSIDIVNKHISRMINLEELDLKDNKIGPKGAEHLCKTIMKHCPKLKYLDLNENGILNDSLLHVAYLLQENRIESLFLVSNHLTPRGIPTLCDGVVSSRYIQELALAFNVLGDEGALIIAKALKNHPSLRSLDISDNRIGDAGAVDIAEHLILSPNSRLESLNLSVNCIGDVGFAAIAEAVAQTRNCRLQHLDLGGNAEVGPLGRSTLIKYISEMNYLQSLDLCSCNLSDEDGRKLTEAVASKTCGIISIEWFNNPAMKLATEKELHETLEAKKISAIKKEKLRHELFILTGVIFGTVLITGILQALRHRRR